jgi:hypothetical protein
MRKNPERLAWTVLGTAFVVFCILAIGIPLGIRYYLLNAMDDQEARLSVIEGTILVQRQDASEPSGVIQAADAAVGDLILTDYTSRGTLDLFERSHVTMYGDTTLRLEQLQVPRFGLSDRPNEITLNLSGGLARVGVALPGERDTAFTVLTPHARLSLEEGSYRVSVTNQVTEVTVVRGQAVMDVSSGRWLIPQGTRTRIGLSGVPTDPLSAAQNLIENGDFQEPLHSGWLTNTVVLDPEVAPPQVEVVENGGRSAVRLVRREQDNGNHSEAAIRQVLDRDVRDYVRLEVSVDVMLEFQSLSGGGQLSSEFPIIVRLDYKDRWGNDQFWTHGFYYQNQDGYPIASDPWGRPLGEQIPRGVWYPFESGNLMELLGESGPVQVTGLTVYASGWNYDSLVTEVQLIVE